MMLLTSLNYSLSLGFAATFLLAGSSRPRCSTRSATWPASSLRRSPPARRSPAARCRSRSPSPAARRRATRSRCAAAAACSGHRRRHARRRAAGRRSSSRRRRRGRIALGRVTLSSDFPIGLWRGWAYVHFPLAGIVVPDARSRTPPPLPAGRAGEDAHSESRDDDADLAGLRAYQPGDPLQRVAWKAVARGAGWYTKQFEGGGGGGRVELAWDALPRDARRRSADRAAHRLGARRRARRRGRSRCTRPASRCRPARDASIAAPRSRALALLPESAAMKPRLASAEARARAAAARRHAVGGADPLARRAACSRPQLPQVAVRADVGRGLRHHAASRCASLLLRARPRARRRHARAHSVVGARRCFALATGFAIRQSFGYFIGRDPCVAFLFVLVGIKYLEARTARDGTLLVCLACFLIVTPFFYSQSLLAALAALPALVVLGDRAAGAGAARRSRDLPLAGVARAARSRTRKLFAQGIPLAARAVRAVSRASRARCGACPPMQARSSGLSDQMAPGIISELSLSDAVAFRVDFDGAVPPPCAALLARAGAVALRRPRMDRLRDAAHAADVRARRRAAPSSTTVTLEPHWKPWLFALDLPAALPHRRRSTPTARGRRPPIGVLTRDQQLFARAPVTQPLRYRQTSVPARRLSRGRRTRARSGRDNLQLPDDGAVESANDRVRARASRRDHPDDADFVRAVLDWFHTEPFFYTLAPPLLPGAIPVDAFLFDSAPRLLRALRERVRRAAARRRHSRARGDRLPGRRDQSDRRLHDRAPVRRARLGRGADRRAMAPLRSDGRRRAVAHRARPRRRAAGERADSAARAPRRRACSRISSSRGMRSTTTGAATSSASTSTRQRSLWRDWKLDRASRRGSDHRDRRRACGRVGRRSCWAGSRGGGARQDRARVLWDALCRASRAPGCRAQPSRRTARLRRARGGALAAVRDRIPRHRRFVRAAALRSAPPRNARRRACAARVALAALAARGRRCCRRRPRCVPRASRARATTL